MKLVLALILSTFAMSAYADSTVDQNFDLENVTLVADPLNCNSKQTQRWFEDCIYHRANCWEYNPGGYCYGAPSAWGRCTGRRPPILGCPTF